MVIQGSNNYNTAINPQPSTS